jgi:hypothetical protein
MGAEEPGSGEVKHDTRGPMTERRRGQVDSWLAARSEGRPSGERSGTHMGVGQPGGGHGSGLWAQQLRWWPGTVGGWVEAEAWRVGR